MCFSSCSYYNQYSQPVQHYLPPECVASNIFLYVANLLTTNASKTEFLLTGLKQQLAKINSCSLDTVHSARNIVFVFDEHLKKFSQTFLLNPRLNFTGEEVKKSTSRL